MIKFIKRYYKPLLPYLFGAYSLIEFIIKFRKFSELKNIKKGYADHRDAIKQNSEKYGDIFKDISEAYLKSKADQKNVDEPYQISQLWQEILNERFSDLTTAVIKKDYEHIKKLLENFHREKFTIGSGGGSDDYFSLKKGFLYKYQFINTWLKYSEVYKDLAGKNAKLSYPLCGNSVGHFHNNEVIPIEAIRYHYYATEIHSLLLDIKNPVVCEIGGGLGGLAYKIISMGEQPMKYILFDIPEMLLISSYFLKSVFPDKKILIYSQDTFDSNALDNYDIIIMPHFMIPSLPSDSVDLFYNSNSFSEMRSATVQEYVSQIERSCRKYFMHVNHDVKFEWCENGEKSGNLPGSKVTPNPEQFKRIYKHPRVFARIEDREFYFSNKKGHFAHLFEKI